MKNTYATPELLSVGAVNEVVLGSKIHTLTDDSGASFPTMGVLDID